MALPFDDAEALEEYGWEVVDDMAYPIPENEAIVYASGHLPVWRKTPDAVDWLKSQTGQTNKGRSSGPGKERRKR